jgi:glycosyltransferase involved in cell wall biosynthesis
MVYIEPTPYIVALVDKLRRVWAGPIEVYYLATDLTQPWGLQLDGERDAVLPAGFFLKLCALWSALRRDRQHTILHLAGWGHPVLFGAMLMAAALGIPVAVESDTPDGRPVRNWRRLFKNLFYPYLFQIPSRFLPGGTRQARYLARFGVKPDRMTIAQMTVDVCAIRRFYSHDRGAVRSAARARWGIASDDKVVLYVGRLEDYKGVQVLLSAFARAVAEEKDLRLAIAGDGSLRSRVEALAADADCRVTYLGRLSGDDVPRAYLAADLLVLPSLSESWGLAINEAMACGLPVIASDQVGCADDLVRQGETGLVVGAGRAAELTAAMRQLAEDEPTRRQMGQAAEHFISNWTLGNEARNIVSAWHEIGR